MVNSTTSIHQHTISHSREETMVEDVLKQHEEMTDTCKPKSKKMIPMKDITSNALSSPTSPIDMEEKQIDDGHGQQENRAGESHGGLASVSIKLFETESANASQKSGDHEYKHHLDDGDDRNNKSSSTLEQESKSETVSSFPTPEQFFQSHISDETNEKNNNDHNGRIFFNSKATSTSGNGDNYDDTTCGEEGDGEEYEGGKYLLRHDIFLPSHLHHNNKGVLKYDDGKAAMLMPTSSTSTYTSLKKHQTLFDNLDRSFEKNLYLNLSTSSTLSTSNMTSAADAVKSITIFRSTQEIIDVVKMCFAAMAVVFSSHNPSVTTMAANTNKNHTHIYHHHQLDETNIVERDFTVHDDHNGCGNNDDEIASISSDSKIPSSMLSRHKNKYSPPASTTQGQENMPPSKKNMTTSTSMTSLVSGMSDENIAKDCTNNDDNYENESIADTLLNENTSTEFVDNMEPVQRPSVPLTVVHMLWRQLIKYRFSNEKKSTLEKEMDAILKLVQCALVEELKFLELVEYVSPIAPERDDGPETVKENKVREDGNNSSSSSSSSTVTTNNINSDVESCIAVDGNNSSNNINSDVESCIAVECIQVNHDIHLQYGRYISKNCAQFFPFYLDKKLKGSKHLLRTYDEDTWNPEEALNATMAKSCLKFFKQYSSKYSDGEKGPAMEQLQFEYSIEMLPWHLMRAMLYRDVVDLLTDYSFVKSRMNALEVKSASQMHIADAEELHSSINILMAKNPNVKLDIDVGQVLVQSYRLIGGIIHCEDSSKWQDEEDDDNDPSDEHEDEKGQEIVEKLNGDSSSDLMHAFSLSKALQSLGDSLSRYSIKSEAMKFYYRAMLKFESINSALSDKSGQSGEDGFKPDTITSSHSHLLMGGILSRIASIYEWQNNGTDAMLCYERSLSFYSRHQSKHHFKGVAKVLASMGQLHFNMKEFEPALSCLRESKKMWKAMEDNVADEIANLLLLMGNVRREMGQLNEALALFSEALYDKVNVFGKSHPEVGFLHQTIGVVYCDQGKFTKGLAHFEDALRIRKSALESVLTHLNNRHNGRDERIRAREIEVAECLQYIGKVNENCGDLEESFLYYEENVSIYRSHLLAAVSNQATIMVGDLVNFLNTESGESSEVSTLYRHLTQAIKVGKQIYSIEEEKKYPDEDIENILEMESHIAEILYDLGLIEGAQYLYRIQNCGNEGMVKLNETLRYDAKTHFEQSIMIRKRIMRRLNNLDANDDDDDALIDYEKITIAIIYYELGKLFSCQEKNTEDSELRRRRSLSYTGKPAGKECASAVSYFEDAREILEDSVEMAETLDHANNEDDCWICRLHKTPEIYEEMLQMMAVLYRKLDEYNKSVECYNKVSLLLTRKEISNDLEPNAEDSMLSCQREKVAFSSQSIGDILFDTGEYIRALESYNEALQLRRSLESDSLDVAETLCLKGNVLLKLKKWDKAILAFDEAFRIRIDQIPQDHHDIATCFHLIGKAYEGDEKFEQALEYYKKSQRILSGHLVDTDTDAADLFFDLGNIVLLQDASSKHFQCDEPNEDDISLALTCLALSRDIYRRSFGADALEVGDALHLLGIIHMKYEEYSKATSLFEKALKIFHGAPLDQSLRIAKSLNNLGLTLMLSGAEDYDIVFQYFDLAKQTYEEKSACNIEGYAELLFNMGEANINNDDIDEAIKSFESALATYEVVLGKAHVSTSIPLEKLGSCLIRERRHKEAMVLLEQALDIRTKHGRHQDLPSAEIYFNMGIIHCETGKLNRAIDCYEEAIKIKTNELGKENIQVAQILNNIGSVFARNKEYQRALKPWQDAIDMYNNAGLSKDDPKVSCTMGNIEFSKRFVSPTPVQSIRHILNY